MVWGETKVLGWPHKQITFNSHVNSLSHVSAYLGAFTSQSVNNWNVKFGEYIVTGLTLNLSAVFSNVSNLGIAGPKLLVCDCAYVVL